MGISRSATLIIYYLITRHVESLIYSKNDNNIDRPTMTLREAYQYVVSKRSIIQPNIGFIKCLIEYEKTMHGIESMTETEYVKIAHSPLFIPDKI